MGLNSTAKKSYKDYAHKNAMGGLSYDVKNPIYRLRIVASSCFFGEPQYYTKAQGSSGYGGYGNARLSDKLSTDLGSSFRSLNDSSWSMTAVEVMEKVIDDALDYSIEATLMEAARLRNEDNIRATPQVILVRAANHPGSKNTGLIREYAYHIVKRGDEPASCLSYQLSKFGKKVPTSLKRALADRLSSFDEYVLSKYRMESRDVKTVDVVNLVHPTHTEALGKLVRGELKNTKTWESMRSDGTSWEEILKSNAMGHMALLRNLRNLKDTDPSLYIEKLKSGVANGKQLPFRYYSAYKACVGHVKPYVLDAIEECLEISVLNVPKFKGKTMSLCDNSGSATGATTSSLGTMRMSEIANITAVLTGKASDEGYIGVFGDRLSKIPVRQKSSIFDAVDNANKVGSTIGAGTEHGIWLFWDEAIRNNEWYDNIFVYSDMQAGHGGLYGDPDKYSNHRWYANSRCIDIPKLVKDYRRKVNPKVNVFLVQVAGYSDTIIPEFYDRTYILGGWGDGILRFANSMIENADNQVVAPIVPAN